MIKVFEQPQKHEPGKLPLLCLKLMAMRIPVDAINAARDYRELKISWTGGQNREVR
jgi:hypothetical protein